jgi:hypothetical protein
MFRKHASHGFSRRFRITYGEIESIWMKIVRNIVSSIVMLVSEFYTTHALFEFRSMAQIDMLLTWV